MITIIVRGQAVPQGSTRAFVVKGRAVTTNKTPDLVAWRNLVAQEANREMAKTSAPLMTGAVSLRLDFLFLRPKSRERAREYWVKTKPDIDKIERAAMDALTGIVYKDDSQVAVTRHSKTYGVECGVVITVTELPIPDMDMLPFNTLEMAVPEIRDGE